MKAFFAFLALVLSASAELDCTLQSSGDFEDGELVIKSVVNPDEATVTVEVVYDGEGWVGIGFATAMAPSVAVIGMPEEAEGQQVMLYSITAKDQSAITPLASELQVLTDASLVQEGGMTTMKFTRPLAAITTDDNEVTEGVNSIIYAYGSNTFGFHSIYKVESAGFPACVKAGETRAPTAAPVAAKMGTSVVDLGNGRIQRNLSFDDVEIILVTDENEETITVEMEYFGQGYIAFAFSLDNQMTDSVAVIALPDDNTGVPQKWNLGGAKEREAITLSEQQTLTGASYTQTADSTTMKFTKPLVEEGEPAVSLTEDNIYLYAFGSSNALEYHASNRAVFSDAGALEPPNKGWWILHGLCMGVSWAIIVPLAVASSLVRKLVPGGDGVWFQVHRALNAFAVLATLVGFFVAVALFEDEQGDNAKHFQTLTHHKMGLIISIFAFIQGVSGVFRPHPPSPPDDDDGDKAATEPEKSQARTIWEYQHKILGAVTMIMGWYNSDTGLEQFVVRFAGPDLTTAMWIVVGVISIATVGLGVLQRSQN